MPNSPYTDRIKGLTPGATYSAQLWALQSDLGQSSEYVNRFQVGDVNIGSCHPTGGDYACSFYKCKTISVTVPSNRNYLDVTYQVQGASHDCDCVLESQSCAATGRCTIANNRCWRQGQAPDGIGAKKYVGAGMKVVLHKTADPVVHYNYQYRSSANWQSGGQTYTSRVNGLVPNGLYEVQLFALRSDMGNSEEYVTNFQVGGNTGSCHPSGGDYDCNLHRCRTVTVRVPAGKTYLDVKYRTVNTSHDCDCDMSSKQCWRQGGAPAGTSIKYVGAGYKIIAKQLI